MKAVVKALAVGGLFNKVFSSGDIVDERCFPIGNFPKLIASGHLELIEEAKPELQEVRQVVEIDIDEVLKTTKKGKKKKGGVN